MISSLAGSCSCFVTTGAQYVASTTSDRPSAGRADASPPSWARWQDRGRPCRWGTRPENGARGWRRATRRSRGRSRSSSMPVRNGTATRRSTTTRSRRASPPSASCAWPTARRAPRSTRRSCRASWPTSRSTRTPTSARAARPITDDVEVLFIGGGFSALLTSARLRERGVESIRIVERGADVGGTWYWNRYPGIACDVVVLRLPAAARRDAVRAVQALRRGPGDLRPLPGHRPAATTSTSSPCSRRR